MNVLSLFDGMGCGRVSLELEGFKINKYYASEIKPHAIKVAMDNFNDIIQLGDVRNININELDKIDLLIGGSPCQDFSHANRDIKGLDGEKKWFIL